MPIYEKGVIRLSNVPILKEPKHGSRMIDQFVFGEHYSILQKSTNEEWFQVKNHFNHNEGWLHTSFYERMSEGLYKEINAINQSIVVSPFAVLNMEQKAIIVPIGSFLPISNNELFPLQNINIYGETIFQSELGASAALEKRRAFLKEKAVSLLNIPYLEGGRTCSGFSMTGFLRVLFQLIGITLRQDLNMMETQGQLIQSESDMEIGDLLFFSSNTKQISHVVMYIGDQLFIHVDHCVIINRMTSNRLILRRNKQHYHLFSIKRLLN